MTLLRAKLRDLSASYPPPSEDKLNNRMRRLERMAKFYEDKAPDAPEDQGKMFIGFVASLVYAMTIIKMHRKLTHRLSEIIKEEETK